MILSYKYKLYPNKKQEQILLLQLELCRWVYNKLLEQYYSNGMTFKNRQKYIKQLKKENPQLKQVYSKVLQMVNYQLQSNLNALKSLKKNGKKTGKLRYKSQNRFRTLNYNQSGFSIDFNKQMLSLSKIGNIKIKIHRKPNGVIKGILITRKKTNEWYAILQVEEQTIELPKINKAIGIDMGVKYFLTTSEGYHIENPKFYEKTLKKIRKLHKQLSRKKLNSKNWEKTRLKLAKLYEKLKNQRNDFLHKLSTFFVKNYDIICLEDLQIKNMVENNKRRLGQKILDASWGIFFRLLSYKAERAGKIVVKVNPRGTSKEYKFGKIDRDYNASLNILERGLQIVGVGRPEFTPVERRPLPCITALAVIQGKFPLRSRKPYPLG